VGENRPGINVTLPVLIGFDFPHRRDRSGSRGPPPAHGKLRRRVLGLSAIYIVTITLLVALKPWNQLGVGESPFVSVLRELGIPGAAGLMNFVALSAALSNANLYLITRALCASPCHDGPIHQW
jgi:amino acid transporter